MSTSLTHRERFLRMLNGQELDRVPFVQYDNIVPTRELWDLCGRENVGILRWTRVYAKESPNCRMESERVRIDGLNGVRNTLVTPAGTLSELKLYEPALNTAATREHFVKDPRDYEILLAYLRDCVVRPAYDTYMAVDRELADDGLPLPAIERTPFQQLWVQWVCLTDLCLHMVDIPDLVQACIAELDRHQREIIEVVAASPAPYVDFADNISAPIIGRTHFARHCVPYYRAMADRFGPSRPVFAHMDGDLLALADQIAASGLSGIDSFSPVPDNDTSVAKAIRLWPGMRLWLNFPSSQHLLSADRIYEVAMDILEQGGRTHRLSIQISENPPPDAWRTSYPAIIRAIRDFGPL